jgi:hypothetical protein
MIGRQQRPSPPSQTPRSLAGLFQFSFLLFIHYSRVKVTCRQLPGLVLRRRIKVSNHAFQRKTRKKGAGAELDEDNNSRFFYFPISSIVCIVY